MKSLLLFLSIALISSCNLVSRNTPVANLATLPPFSFWDPKTHSQVSSSQIPAGSPIILLYFKTDCPFCEAETRSLIKNIDSLKDARLYFLTAVPVADLDAFTTKYHLNEYTNIVAARDYQYSFARTFKPQTVPYMAIYDGDKKLIKIFKGSVPVEMVIEALKG
jgi:thioredoxin-related protein